MDAGPTKLFTPELETFHNTGNGTTSNTKGTDQKEGRERPLQEKMMTEGIQREVTITDGKTWALNNKTSKGITSGSNNNRVRQQKNLQKKTRPQRHDSEKGHSQQIGHMKGGEQPAQKKRMTWKIRQKEGVKQPAQEETITTVT